MNCIRNRFLILGFCGLGACSALEPNKVTTLVKNSSGGTSTSVSNTTSTSSAVTTTNPNTSSTTTILSTTSTTLSNSTSTTQPGSSTTITTTSITTTTAPGTSGTVPPIPNLIDWESRMKSGGTQFCVKADIDKMIGVWGIYDDASTPWSDGEGSVWYYDGAKVYYQIAAYTGDATWNNCADYSNTDYRDWVLAQWAGVNYPVGRLNGWRMFPHGLLKTFKKNGDTKSRDAVHAIANFSAFADAGGAASCDASRETAYVIHSYLAAEEMGENVSSHLSTAVGFALGHIDQWFVSKTCTMTQPFMVGLTLDALIHYWEHTQDSRVLPAVKTAVDGLWQDWWDANKKAFMMNTADRTGAPDLNLLIAPAYAWMWQMTGDSKYQSQGDQAFSGGVLGATFWSGKQFSQNYRWSFSYVKWRKSLPGSLLPLTNFSY